MLIQLKQAEIVSAIKQYVAQQGINLTGKTVDIAFTHGRKENGLSADVTIEDTEIPGTLVGDVEAAVKPAVVLAVVNNDPIPVNPAPAPEEPAKVPEADTKPTPPSLFGT